MDLHHARAELAPQNNWTMSFRPARHRGSVPAWIALPRRPRLDRSPIVAVHGLARGSREQAKLLAPLATARGHIVIAPHFNMEWRRYQQLVIKGRADLALLELLNQLRQELRQFSPPAQKIVLTGFSGGAQFAHRFAMLHPQTVERVVATAAGWYTFPNDAPFPYGLKPGRGSAASWGPAFGRRLDDFFGVPITVAVGEFDCVPDRTVRRAEKLDAIQGTDRFTRGQRWVNAVNDMALARGLVPRVSFQPLKECAHDFAMCATVGGLDRIIVAPPGTGTPW